MVNAIATIKPPTTGSGILNVCKTRMRFTRKNRVIIQNLLKQVFDRYQKQYSRNILLFSLVSRILMSCVQVQPPQCQHYYVIHVVIGSPFLPRSALEFYRSSGFNVIFRLPEWNSRLACSEIKNNFTNNSDRAFAFAAGILMILLPFLLIMPVNPYRKNQHSTR